VQVIIFPLGRFITPTSAQEEPYDFVVTGYNFAGIAVSDGSS